MPAPAKLPHTTVPPQLPSVVTVVEDVGELALVLEEEVLKLELLDELDPAALSQGPL